MSAAAGPALALGLAVRAQAQPGSLHALWQAAQAALPALHPAAVHAVAALPQHLAHPALAAWLAASGLGHARCLPAPPEALAAQPTRSASAQALARYGCGSVAEACALWAAGPAAPASALLLPRLIAPDGSATLAVAAGAACVSPPLGICP